MPQKPKHNSAQKASLETALLVLFGVACSIAVLQTRLPFGASLTESVCISVTVIGSGSDTTTGACRFESSSVSSGASSIASSTGSTGGIAESGGEGTTTDDVIADNGGRRYSVERSRWHILRLLREREATRRAARTPPSSGFRDVPDDAWYADDLRKLRDQGLLDDDLFFRPEEGATRADTISLLVRTDGGVKSVPPLFPSFDDVPRTFPRFALLEDGARRGWILGYDDCLGTHPCFTRPNAIVTRAEGAAMIVRAFDLRRTGDAPRFSDVPVGPWYTRVMQIAADHCVLQGSGERRLGLPERHLSRAELVAMLRRALDDLSYGTDCSWQVAERSTSFAGLPVEHLLTAPSAAFTLESLSCMDGILSCLAQAAVTDAKQVFSSLIGSLLFPGWGDIRSAHATESVGWLVLIVWMIIALRFTHIHRHRHAPSSPTDSEEEN